MISPVFFWRSRRHFVLALAAALLCATASARAQATDHTLLHSLFTDHVVLQRGRQIPVWGWTKPGATVTVKLNGQTATATAGSDGKWLAKLPSMSAGGPFDLEVSGPESATIHDVLIGDVWICSGQSNMEMGIKNVNNATQEVAQANYPQIRLYSVPHKISYHPVDTVPSHWDVCTPESIANGGWGGFSAVGYFFGRALQDDLHVPIGLIHTSWGGTIAEAWTSGEKLVNMPDFADAVRGVQQRPENESADAFAARVNKWWQENDPGSRGATWAESSTDDSSWKSMNLPTAWEEAGLPDYDGVVWFRKEISLPSDWDGREAVLHLGPIDDQDVTYVNGRRIGAIDFYNVDRNYKIDAGILKAGRNVIAVRVLDTGGNGGIYGQPAQLKLERAGDSTGAISLAGEWKYNASASLKQTKPLPQNNNNNPNIVTVLYNGMIAPLLPYGIKGAIWYQGESNAGRARQYQTLLPTMIEDWRSRFDSGHFPFFIVQLANFMAAKSEPSESAWAELREAQAIAAKKAGDSGIAVAIDIGDPVDIHPKNKQEVGRRLSLVARAVAYHEAVIYSGPVYRDARVDGKTIIIRFDYVDGGLVTHGDKTLKGFAVAGEDKKFVWAGAIIRGRTVVVTAPSIEHPVYVRYDWADNPDGNLYNKTGLPAAPFRTDH